jgi:hypothetical protein
MRTESGLEEGMEFFAKAFGMMVARHGVEPPTPAFSGSKIVYNYLEVPPGSPSHCKSPHAKLAAGKFCQLFCWPYNGGFECLK